MQHSYDVAIVGGGTVGLTLALALAQKTSLSILLIESQVNESTWDASTYHHRVSAIALSSQRIFKSLAVWDAIKSKRISPFDTISIWDVHGGTMQFACQDVAEPILGYIIENNVVQSALHEKLKQYAQVSYQRDLQLTGYTSLDKSAELTTASGDVYRCKLVVAADGARSWLREQAGIACDKHSYDQTAIVTSVTSLSPHQSSARQVFLQTGPLGFLPLVDPYTSSIVWSLPSDLAESYMALDDAGFKAALNRVCADYLGVVKDVSRRYVFQLGRQRAQQYSLPRLALVGDAAHVVHPLAGQGVNMGLLDAASLAEIIISTLKARRDIGGISALRRYERWRKGDNALMMHGIDVIKRVFSVEQPYLQHLRTSGLQTADEYTWLKNVFTRHAVGNRDGLPQLAQACKG